jgi:plastocyanin
MRTPRRRRPIAAAIVMTVAAVAGACGDDAGRADADADRDDGKAVAVTIKTFAFQPNPIAVPAGTTITWTNTDDILHTVTSGPRGDPDGTFDEQLDGPGSTAELTFAEAGRVTYHCTIHPGMDAVVDVT